MPDQFDKLKAEVQKGTRVISLAGLTSISAKAYLLTRLHAETGKRFAVVTQSNTELEAWVTDLDYFRSQISDLRSQIPNPIAKARTAIPDWRLPILLAVRRRTPDPGCLYPFLTVLCSIRFSLRVLMIRST